ncbi:Predicted glutamine synthetase [Phaffia rhodozyma]|uniref:Predicted glutamine synthetase n=1 Tax=Phaffia rhodozyma TaxID=264483 RepID=A0A0F7SJA3_PHARH|nr:Predicted glutamine synthetase [Phaffia rhodozyma]
MPRKIHIALLLCDTPIPAVRQAHGTYLDIFRTHLLASLPAAQATKARGEEIELVLDGYQVTEGKLPSIDSFEQGKEGAYEGLMITGSAHCSFDDKKNPWVRPTFEFIKKVGDEASHIKIIGICFGLQLITRAYGGKVVKNPAGWEIGTYEVQLNELGQKVFKTPTVNIQQMHSDYAPALPPSGDLQVLGSTERSPIQGFVKFNDSETGSENRKEEQKIHILGFQGHPEFHPSIVQKIIDARSSTGLFTPEMTVEARDRADRPHDGLTTLGGVMWDVLLGDA